MKITNLLKLSISAFLLSITSISILEATVSTDTLASISTLDKVKTFIGTLMYKDGVPTLQTAKLVRDKLDFTRALNVYNNSFRGASAYAIAKGFEKIGVEDNSVTIFST